MWAGAVTAAARTDGPQHLQHTGAVLPELVLLCRALAGSPSCRRRPRVLRTVLLFLNSGRERGFRIGQRYTGGFSNINIEALI